MKLGLIAVHTSAQNVKKGEIPSQSDKILGEVAMRILVIGMADSVHLAKWLKQFSNSGHVFEIVSSSPHRRVHPILKDLLKSSASYRLHWISRLLSLPLWVGDRVLRDWLRGSLIAWRSRSFKPDLVHVLEFQNGGYSYLRATQLTKSLDVPLLLTPYGSDIYWFQQFPEHLVKIQKLLRRADGISSECQRDELLAREYGFQGKFGPRLPASGGMNLLLSRSQNQIRTRISVKGYQNHWGQALVALKCIEDLAEVLQDFEITLFSCNRKTLKAASRLSAKTGLKVTAFGKGALKNDQVHRILSESIALVSLSKSDGVPASMLEAMANGAVPIQSNTSAADEWLEHDHGGFLVKWDDVDTIKEKLLYIVNNPQFRESAAERNFERLKSSIDSQMSRELALQTYEMLIPTKP